MKTTRLVMSLVMASCLASTPAMADERHETSAQSQQAGNRARLWTGAILGAAGGAAIVLGTTALKSEKTTSGNAPQGAYDACVAARSNSVYQGNACDVLKGPRTPLVIGGAITAAAGAALMMLGLRNSSVNVSASGVTVRHRVTF